MPYQKGQSGNPGGRPKKLLANGRSLRDLAREHTEECILTLATIMRDGDSDATRRAAAVDLLDRGWGKPTQSVIVDDAQGALVDALDTSGLSEAVLRELAQAADVKPPTVQ